MVEEGISAAVAAKAARYHAERRLNVIEADASGATVLVQGSDTEPYTVTYDGMWHCDCPARLRCAHIEAASMVVHRSTTFEKPTLDSNLSELDKFLLDN